MRTRAVLEMRMRRVLPGRKHLSPLDVDDLIAFGAALPTTHEDRLTTRMLQAWDNLPMSRREEIALRLGLVKEKHRGDEWEAHIDWAPCAAAEASMATLNDLCAEVLGSRAYRGESSLEAMPLKLARRIEKLASAAFMADVPPAEVKTGPAKGQVSVSARFEPPKRTNAAAEALDVLQLASARAKRQGLTFLEAFVIEAGGRPADPSTNVTNAERLIRALLRDGR